MKRAIQDTSPEAERVLVDLWRKAAPARKFSLAFDTTRTLQEFTLAGLEARHREETPDLLWRRHPVAGKTASRM